MPNLLLHPWSGLFSAWLLGGFLIAAAIPKIGDPPAFAQNLFAYHLLPAALLSPVALTLPWLELWTGVGLLLPRMRRSAALLALGVMLVFLGALGSNLARGNALDCGCFGAAKTVRTRAQKLFDMKVAIARDLGLGLLALHLLAVARRNESTAFED